MSNPNKTHIKLFITKTNKFRVEIREPNEPPYQVKVGGSEWNKGKGSKHREVILSKIEQRLINLREQYIGLSQTY